jgi:2-phosphoglycerate kinase
VTAVETETALVRRLSHVLWVGGSPCAGKSSIVKRLAAEYGLRAYHCDEALGQHLQRLTPKQEPILYKWTHTDWNTLWMRPVRDLLDETIAAYREHWRIVVADLLALPVSPSILAEGNCLLPGKVRSVLAHPGQAIWIVSTSEFQRTHYPVRDSWVEDILNQCADPRQALQNWMDRDVEFAEWVCQEAADLGFSAIKVDGRRTIAETAALVAGHLALSEESRP